MQFGIVHFSDIHFKKANNSILKKTTNICDAIVSKAIECRNIIFIISGDIAFSGNNEEYSEAFVFLEEIKETLLKRLHFLENIFVATSPGNHDCDLSQNQFQRGALIDSLFSKKNNTDIKLIKELNSVQSEYTKFISENYPSEQYHDLFNVFKFEFDNKIIRVISYNTAWCSQNPEKNDLIFPDGFYKEILDFDSNQTIQIFHHPTNWMTPESKRHFENNLSNVSGLIFCGHEHEGDIVENRKINKIKSNIYCLGNVLQDSYNEANSGFNLLLVNFEENIHFLNNFVWNNSSKIYETHISDNKFNLDISENGFAITSTYDDEINNLGFYCTHPRKNEGINLNDIYVFPDLYNITENKISEELTFSIRYNSEKLPTSDQNRFILIGDEISGKTKLLKQLQKKYLDSHIVGVYLKSSELTEHNISPSKFQQLLEKAFTEQYGAHNVLKYSQLSNDKKAVFIDDYVLPHLENERLFNTLIETLSICTKYSFISINSNDELKLTSSSIKLYFKDYQIYKIMEFGHLLVDKMIDRWLNIDYSVTSRNALDILEDKERIKKLITVTSNNDFMPRYPLFIINILQMNEATNTSTNGRDFAELYESLISRSLESVNLNSEQKIIIPKYLGGLAFKMYELKRDEITEIEMQTFICDFMSSRGLTAEVINIQDKLSIARILKIDPSKNVSFAQPYLYYYYLSLYIVSNTKIQEQNITSFDFLKSLINKLHVVENINLIIFIIHHARNIDHIYDLVIQQSLILFEGVSETTLEDKEYQNIASNISSEVYKRLEENMLDNNKNYYHQQDNAEEHLKDNVENSNVDSIDSIKELDLFSKINLALKLIEILGLISRTKVGDPKDEKIQLIKHVASLGFKCINALLGELEEHHETVIDELKSFILKRKLKVSINEAEIKDKAKEFIGNLAIAFTYISINKISASIASKNTIYLFTNMLANNNAYELLYICTELELPSGLNVSNIITLSEKYKNNNDVIALNILRVAVRNHIYKFQVDRAKVQSLASKLFIAPRSLLISQNKLIH